jgi:hypothetical protein
MDVLKESDVSIQLDYPQLLVHNGNSSHDPHSHQRLTLFHAPLCLQWRCRPRCRLDDVIMYLLPFWDILSLILVKFCRLWQLNPQVELGCRTDIRGVVSIPFPAVEPGCHFLSTNLYAAVEPTSWSRRCCIAEVSLRC